MASVAAQSFEVNPLSPAMGAEIRGLDLSNPLSPQTWKAVRAAYLQYQVLAFRDQTMDEDEHEAFAQRFGELQVHVLNQYHKRGNPRVLVITNIDENGKPIGEHPDPGAAIWHTDGSWSAQRALATMLYGMHLPKWGGDTLFTNMYAAYEGLSDAMKRRLEGMKAVHDLNYSRSQTSAKQQMSEEQKRAAPPVEHDVIRVHPETGRKAIYLGQHASHIAGMPLDEGRALVQEINAHATQDKYRYAHPWRLRDFVMWDNRCVMHKATEFDWMNDVRILRRTTTVGERIPAFAA
jgi:taurine dioxygenase